MNNKVKSLLIGTVVVIIVGAGFVLLKTNNKFSNTARNSNQSAQMPSYKCDPNDPKVTKNLRFIGVYNGQNLSTPAGNFSAVSGNNYDKKWIHEPEWDVCGKPAILIGNLSNSSEKEEQIYYNGNLYAVPIGSIPLKDIHSQIAYMTGYFGKAIIDGVTYDLSNVKSHLYSVSGKIAGVITEQGGSTDEKAQVFYDGKVFGEYPDILSEIKSVGGLLTFINKTSKDSYPTTELVQGNKVVSENDKYVGIANGWDNSFVEYRGAPAYIAASEALWTWRTGASVPTVNKNVKYEVKQGGKNIGGQYDGISFLTTIDGKLGFEAVKNNKSLIVFDEKEYGSDCDAAANIMDAGNDLAYLCIKGKKGVNMIFDVIKGGKIVAELDKPYVFYPRRSMGNWGDVTFIGPKVAIVVRSPNDGQSYVQYGDKRIFEGYSIGSVANIGGKLVIQAEKDRVDYVLIEN